MNRSFAGPDCQRVWLEVSDALLAGITHDLNGRVTAIGGLLQVLSPDRADPEALELLRREGEHLDQAVGMLRRYPRGNARGAEAIDPRELLPDLLLLHARRDDRQGASARLEIAGEAPPARAGRTWLARALLVLFARAGGETGSASFIVRASAEGSTAVWTVRPESPAGESSGAVPSPDPYVLTAGAFLQLAGGELRGGASGWDVLLPAVV